MKSVYSFFVLTFLAICCSFGISDVKIIIPRTPSRAEAAVASDMARIMQIALGEKIHVLRENFEDNPKGIYLGSTLLGKKALNKHLELDDDDIVLDSKDGSLVLVGKEELSTEFAVYYFLHKYIGARWYCPGELGEHIPQVKDWEIPEVSEIVRPSYMSRSLSDSTEGYELWTKRNFLHQRFSFSHAFHRLLPPELYDQHPEWFPLIKGKRFKPRSGDTYSWQPEFGSVELAKYIGKRAVEYFKDNRGKLSFSVGINDNAILSNSDESNKYLDATRYFRGQIDASDLVFNFTNQVAEEVAEVFPNKYVGQLAYYIAENVPTFPVHPNVVPFLTADRSQYYDPLFVQKDKELIKKWTIQGPKHIGLYDYYYGSPFFVPRIFFRYTDELVKFAHNQGVSAFYAEIYSNWGIDGPKAWLIAQLLWDSDQDKDVLLNDFYKNYFKEVAEPMRAFFEMAEKAWCDQPGSARWLKYFGDVSQGDLFPPELCQVMRSKISEAQLQAQGEIVKKRLQLVSEAFKVTELLSGFQSVNKRLHLSPCSTKEEALICVDDLQEYEQAKEDFGAYLDELVSLNPIHKSFRDAARRYFLCNPTHRALLKVLEYSDDYEVRSKLEELRLLTASKDIINILDIYLNNQCENVYRDQKELVRNGKFILGNSPVLYNQVGPSERVCGDWVIKEARPGTVDLQGKRISNSYKASVSQWIRVNRGEIYLFSAKVKGKISPGNVTYLQVSWANKEGKALDGMHGDRLIASEYNDWETLSLVLKAPPQSHSVCITLQSCFHEEDDFVEIDYFSVIRLNENS